MARIPLHWFKENLGLKLFALALAVLIWTTVHDMIQGGSGSVGFGRTRTLTDVPVWVLVRAGNSQGFRVEPSTVEVTVRGPRELVEALDPEDLRVVVRADPESGEPGQPLPVEVVAPEGVTVVRVQPSRIRVWSPPD